MLASLKTRVRRRPGRCASITVTVSTARRWMRCMPASSSRAIMCSISVACRRSHRFVPASRRQRRIALEPQAPLIRVLRWIYGRDRNVTLVHAAAARSSGTVQLNLNPSNPTIATASREFIEAAKDAQNWDNERWTGAVDVAGISLDELISPYWQTVFHQDRRRRFEAEALAGLSAR